MINQSSMVGATNDRVPALPGPLKTTDLKIDDPTKSNYITSVFSWPANGDDVFGEEGMQDQNGRDLQGLERRRGGEGEEEYGNDSKVQMTGK